MARQIKSEKPDLSPDQARSSIIGYIYGVTPGLAVPLVFGMRRPFMQTICQKLVPKGWREKDQDLEQKMNYARDNGNRAEAPKTLFSEAAQSPKISVPGDAGSHSSLQTRNWVERIYGVDHTSSGGNIYEMSMGVGYNHNASVTRPTSSSTIASQNALLGPK